MFAALAPLEDDRLDLFVGEARDSLARQARIEADDSISFEEYLADYYRS